MKVRARQWFEKEIKFEFAKTEFRPGPYIGVRASRNTAFEI